jgi:hypothetical protein
LALIADGERLDCWANAAKQAQRNTPTAQSRFDDFMGLICVV